MFAISAIYFAPEGPLSGAPVSFGPFAMGEADERAQILRRHPAYADVSIVPIDTLARARSVLARHGISITRKLGEYRVNRRGASEATAYYTTDLADAVGTGAAMAREK